jgi:hypothetical protein
VKKGGLETVTRTNSPIKNHEAGIDLTIDKPANYCIRVAGHLDQSWSNRLGGMTISVSTHEERQEISTLSGRMIDQAALFGVLKALYDMRLPLLSVECQEFDRN